MLRLAPISCSDKTRIGSASTPITIRRLGTVDHRRHRLRIGNGCQRSSRTAEAVECRRHVFARIVNEMVNPEQARERLLVGAACPECSSNARRPLPGVTGSYRTLLGSEQNPRQLICRAAVASMEDREKRTMPSPAFGELRSSCDRSHRVLANLIPNLQHD